MIFRQEFDNALEAENMHIMVDSSTRNLNAFKKNLNKCGMVAMLESQMFILHHFVLKKRYEI